jgi:hypothetical protein
MRALEMIRDDSILVELMATGKIGRERGELSVFASLVFACVNV